MSGLFVTGTDTGIGKTWITVAIMERLRQQGSTVLGMKPVASGCARVDGELVNDDALLLQRHGSVEMPYSVINPYAFEPPIAPHIAAAQCRREIDFERILQCYRELSRNADNVIVEGVGGLLVPLSAKLCLSDLISTLELPVVLVVGMRLGCINHALLSYNEIVRRKIPCVGWVANVIDADMSCIESNIEILERAIDAPLLGRVPHIPTFDPAALAEGLQTLPADYL